ncbi:hypothetical protein GGH94_006312 [Coemansia aciculifera]|uniref:Uncharacterized protein n=1 Tax=Coemansia aciculifera TaxID=417176 RepID=A0A9W8IJQ0_9FUNG|nr:hypothetical protein GGH94_006312 [Coemansia aciculifera]
MTTLSLFQILPTPVTERIVNYAADYEPDMPSFNPVDVNIRLVIRCAEPEAKEQLVWQLPLLWVCSNFCAVVLANCCKRYTVRFISSELNRCAVTWNMWPGHFKSLGIPVHFLAKELLMEVSLRDIYFGHALGIPSR